MKTVHFKIHFNARLLLSLLVLSFQDRAAAAQLSSVPREDVWLPGAGMVNAVALNDGIVYVGGSFQAWVPSAPSSLDMFDMLSGALRHSFPNVHGIVHAIVSDEEGGWYVGGEFVGVGDVLTENLAHVRRDMSVDANWRPNLTGGGVYTLSLGDDVLYVGGAFTQAGGEARTGLAAIQVSTGAVTPWNPTPGANRQLFSVGSVARFGQTLYVGGQYFVGSPSDKWWMQGFVLALSTKTGDVLPWNPALTGDSTDFFQISTLLISGNTLIVNWTQAVPGSTLYGHLAAFDAATGERKPWPSSDGGYYVAIAGNTVYVSQAFDHLAGQPREGLGALDLETGQATSWDPVSAAANPEGKIIAAGTMLIAGDVLYMPGYFGPPFHGNMPADQMMAIDLTTGRALPWQSEHTGFNIYPALVSGSTLFAIANLYGDPHPGVGDNVPRNLVAALDARTGKLLDWKLPLAEWGGVNAIAVTGNSVYLGGSGLGLPGNPPTPLGSLLRADAHSGQLKSWTPAVNLSSVSKLMASGGTVYAVGSMSDTPENSVNVVVSLDGETGATNWIQTTDSLPWDLKLANDSLYLSGSFKMIGGVPHLGALAALDAKTGALKDWNPPIESGVATFVIAGDTLYAGGSLTEMRDQTKVTRHLEAVDLATGALLNLDPDADGLVLQLALVGDSLIVAGDFTRVGNQDRTRLAAVDLPSGLVTDWNPGANRTFIDTFSIATSENTLYVAGPFTTIGGRYQPKFAVFPMSGSPAILNQPDDRDVAAGQSADWSVQVKSDLPVSCQWTFNGQAIPGATSAAFRIANAQPSDSGQYALIASNPVGAITSRPVTFRVLQPVSIVQQPVSQTVVQGNKLELSVNASGSTPLGYQWRLNGANLPGQVLATLLVDNVQPANAGLYTVAVGNVLGAIESSPAEVMIQSPPSPLADHFADRGTLSGFSWWCSGNNVGATADPGEPWHAGKDGGHSLWVRWIAPMDAIVALDTRGSSIDTLLAVYTGTSVGALTEIASDNDSGGFFTSSLKFSATAETEYEIVVDGLLGATGSVVLNGVVKQYNPGRLPVIMIPPQSQATFPGMDVTLAVVATSDTPLKYQWFFNDQIIPGATTDRLVLRQVTVEEVGFFYVEVTNDAGTIRTEPASLQISSPGDGLAGPMAEDKMREVLAPVPSAGLQNLTLNSTPLRPLTLAPGAGGYHVFSTRLATKEPGEPIHCGRIGGASYWFPLKPSSDGLLTVSTEGSLFNTLLAVYARKSPDSTHLAEVISDDNSGRDGEDSFLRFPAKAGTVYYVAVDGVNNAKGVVRLSYTLDSLATLPTTSAQVKCTGPSRSVEMEIHAISARTCRVQTSTDLVHWSNVMTTNLTTGNSFSFREDATLALRRFYRTLPVP